MMNLKYKVTFLDYWHTSSGLSAGARLDSSVVKDSDELPYLSGKTIKGLTREMAELLGDCTFVNNCFGGSSNNGKNNREKDICYDEKFKNKEGKLYFSNVSLEKEEKKEIVSNRLQNNLYATLASTQIGSNGIAVDNSLREIEVVIPITLYGEILDIDSQEDKEKLLKALKMIKRIGLNRNRGLGRCIIEEVK